MAKRAGSSDGAPIPKRMRNDEGTTSPSSLADEGAWHILEQFLSTDMTYADMEEALLSYLGARYRADDWKDARDALFSGDGDDSIALANLLTLKATHILQSSDPQKTTNRRISNVHAKRSRKRSKARNPYIDIEAGEDDEATDDSLCDSEVENEDSPSVPLPDVRRLAQSSAKDRLAAAIDDIFVRYEENAPSSSQGSRPSRAVPSTRAVEKRMYLLHVHRTATQYIAEQLRGKGFPVTVSAWAAGQLYVVSDSPKTIAASLPASHSLSVKQYIRILEEEQVAVELSYSKLPSPGWVKIKQGKYKGDIGYVFESERSNGFVAVLIPPREFPYPMPQGSVSLFDRSRVPNNGTVSDIIRDEKVVGWMYRGERYYMGLLLKDFHRDRLESVACPHADDIQLHLQSKWDKSFFKKSLVAFSMQFIHVGDAARVISGEVCSEIGTVVSTDHAFGSVRLSFTLDGRKEEIEARLQDVERVFWVGDTVRVVAGSYLGLEGHILRMNEGLFHICQAVTNEEVEVSKYYLDRCPLNRVLQPQPPAQQHLEPPPRAVSIQIGDSIEVLAGEHRGKCGIVDWFPTGGTDLWFRELSSNVDDKSSAPPTIQVPAAVVRLTKLGNTLKFTKEKGYDVKPGDNVRVARGPEFGTEGVVQMVDLPNAQLTLVSADRLLINVPIEFAIKLHDVNEHSFNSVIGKEVFVIGGERKGYRAVLYGLAPDTCMVALHGQPRTTLKRYDVATRYAMRLDGTILTGTDLTSFCEMRKRSYISSRDRSITPPPINIVPSSSSAPINPASSSTSEWTSWNSTPGEIDMADTSSSVTVPMSSTGDPWNVTAEEIQDNLEARAEKLSDSGPLHWLMSREFFSQLSTYHVVLKVSPSFMGGKLHNRFVYAACPDPFLGENGPAPEGCIAASCSSSGAGAMLQHYHIPAKDLSPAPPRKKNQSCLVLDGDYRGHILTVGKCNMKANTVIIGTTGLSLRFDQICLVQLAQNTM